MLLFKVNVDGTVFATWKEVSLGVLSRDDKGQLVVALSKKVHAPFGALEIEAKALK